MIQVLVILRVILIKDIISYRLQDGTRGACLNKLIVGNRGQEYLLISPSKADHKRVYLNALSDIGGFVINMLARHKASEGMVTDKVHRHALIFIYIADRAQSIACYVLVNGTVSRVAEGVYV